MEYKNTTIKTEAGLKIVERIVGNFIKSSRKPLDKFGETEVINYFNKLDEKYSASSSNDFKVMIKVFIKWNYEDWSSRFRSLDVLCKKKKVEPKYSPDDMLKKEDIEKLVQEETEPRWKCFWLIFSYGRFRPTEVCTLKWEDITFAEDEAFVTLKATKNSKTFEKYLPSNAVFYLKKLQNNGSSYVFPTKRKHKGITKKGEERISVGDKPQTRSGVYQHLRDISPRVFGRHINPYILRHSIATILYNKEGLKDDDVANQMGHTSDMKKVYSHPSKKQMREKMKKLYITAEELPPEKKAEYEEQMRVIMKEITELKAMINPEIAKDWKNKKMIIRGEN